MTIIARKYLTAPTPQGEAKQVILAVESTAYGFIVTRNGREIPVGPYMFKHTALAAAELTEGEGLEPERVIARRMTHCQPMGSRITIAWLRVVERAGAYIVIEGDIVIATCPDASTALDCSGLKQGEGVTSMAKTFACHA